MRTVLVVDDDEDLRLALVQAFELADFRVLAAANAEDAMQALAAGLAKGQGGRRFPGVVVSDIRMPGMSGLALLQAVRVLDPDVPVVLVTGHGDVPLAVEAMREGAWDFVEKPFSTPRLLDIAARAAEHRRLVLDNRALREADGDVPVALRGTSPFAREAAERFGRLRAARGGALVTGPPGSDADVLLRDLLAPFEPARRVDCASLGDLAELELFGANGLLEASLGGALALAAVCALSSALQRRVAEADGAHDSVLVLSAADPAALDPVLAQAFEARRLDLVPLRQRREDVPALFVSLASRAAARFGRPVPDLPPGFDRWLAAEPLEGDVAGLRTLAEQFVLGLKLPGSIPAPAGAGRLQERIRAHERLLIEAELARHDGRIRPTYEALGLSRKGLYDKMRRLGIAAPRRNDGDG